MQMSPQQRQAQDLAFEQQRQAGEAYRNSPQGMQEADQARASFGQLARMPMGGFNPYQQDVARRQDQMLQGYGVNSPQGRSPLADMEQNYMEGMRRSGQENMRKMSPEQMYQLQNSIQQLQGYGVNSPQGQLMLG